eukprot:Clim_evm28s153 gene=Clim_evmTU28s153
MSFPELKGKVGIVLGAQWGDEGKGKLVDILACDADIVARCAGGNNAGHTIHIGDVKYDFHLLPSGIIHEAAASVIGNGVVIHLPSLFAELEANEAKGLKGWENRLIISDRAHLVFDMHQRIDGLEEAEKGSGHIGTTKKGIGPTYSAKAGRWGFRVCDILGDQAAFAEKFTKVVANYQKRYPDLKVDVDSELARYKDYAERIRPMVRETALLCNKAIKEGNKFVLIEGANAAMLDLDFGTYPFVTSSSAAVGGACTGLGIPPTKINEIFGVVKAYTTRVGGGPFPTEQLNQAGDSLQEIGHEYGVTTGRRRRCGWLDLVVVNYTSMVNGYTAIMLTKLDVLDSFEDIKIGVAYKLDGRNLESFPADLDLLAKVDVEYITLPGWKTSTQECRTWDSLPPNAKAYVKKIEELTGVPVKWIGVGSSRDATIRVF